MQLLCLLTMNNTAMNNKVLKIKNCRLITPSILENIAHFTPKIQKLCFSSCYNNGLDEHLIYISNLRRLKSLFIDLKKEIPVGKFIDSLIENNVPIEILELWSERNYSTTNLNIAQLKLLKKSGLQYMSDGILINCVINLPALEEIIARKSPDITSCYKNVRFTEIAVKKNPPIS